jgi:beta-lactam-binding protein with PASTA domain
MTWKKMWKFLCSGFFWKNIGVAFCIIVFVVFVTLVSLRFATRHGEEITVPDLIGLYEEEANVMLNERGIVGVLIDSAYVKGKLPGEILEQNPQKGSLVKKDRKVYYTVNSKMAKTVPLPDLSDVSFRQGKAVLESLGFVVGEIIYEFSEYDGLIRSVLYDEKEVAFGTPLADGANLILVVGKSCLESASTPNLLHLTRQQAEMLLTSSGFVLGAVFYDGTQPLSEEEDRLYKVYKQSPEANVDLSQGTRIDIWLTMDAAKMYEESEPELEEEFF